MTGQVEGESTLVHEDEVTANVVTAEVVAKVKPNPVNGGSKKNTPVVFVLVGIILVLLLAALFFYAKTVGQASITFTLCILSIPRR